MTEEEEVYDDEFADDEEDFEGAPYEGEGGLGEEIQRQLKAAPWYLTSAAAHMIVLLLLMLIPTSPPTRERKKIVLKTQVVEEIEKVEEEEEPEPEPEEDPLDAVMKETDSAFTSSEVVTETNIETDIQIDTDIQIEEIDDVVGEPSEDEIADASEDSAPSLMGVRGSAFSNRSGLSSGFRGGFGKIGRGIKGMVGRGKGGGMGKGLCLIWLLDQSGSMKDDQEKVSQQARDIQDLLTDGGRKSMLSGVVTYGQNWQMTQPLTKSSSQITEAILNVEVDTTGVENTCQAVTWVCQEIMAKKAGWTKIIVILSDESSSDQYHRYTTPGEDTPPEMRLNLSSADRRLPMIEVALKSLVKERTRLFVIGKESPFQSSWVREPYIDQSGKRWNLAADRGPETPFIEVPISNSTVASRISSTDFTGELVAGYGVYDLAYLAKGSKGAYFILDEQAAAKRPMSPSERARKPFTIDWAIMDMYTPLVVSRMNYEELLLQSGKQGRKVAQLNKYMNENKDAIRRVYHCAPSQHQHFVTTMRARKELLGKLIEVIGDARATDEEILASKERRQMANIDLWYATLLADQIITDAWLDAFEAYRGSTSNEAPEGYTVGLSLRPKQGDALSEEEKILFEDRMRQLTEACNEVIRRHSNTPYAICARWMVNGPRKWGRPYELIRHVGKRGGPSPRRPRM